MTFLGHKKIMVGGAAILLFLCNNAFATEGGFNCKPKHLSSANDVPSVLINNIGGIYWQGTSKSMDFYCASVNSGYRVTHTSRFTVADFNSSKPVTCYMARIQQSSSPFGINVYVGSVKSTKTTKSGINFLSLSDTGTQQSLHWNLYCNLPERTGSSGSGILYTRP